MCARRDFELDTLLGHLQRLAPECVAPVPLTELEFILADLVVSEGRRLRLNRDQWLDSKEKEALWRFAASWWPFFVAPDFQVTEEQLRTLALATTCFHLHTAFMDQLVDDPQQVSPELALAIPHILERWFQLSAQLFDGNSRYWSEVRQIQYRMSRAMIRERRRRPPAPLTLDEYLDLSRGRVAFTCFSAIGLTLLNGTPERLPALYDFWTGVSLAALIHDDICDWMQDYRNGTYSYLHLQMLFSPPFRAEVEAGKLPSVNELGSALFLSDLAELLYDIAHEEARKACIVAEACGYERHGEIGRRTLHLLEGYRKALLDRKLRLFLKVEA